MGSDKRRAGINLNSSEENIGREFQDREEHDPRPGSIKNHVLRDS